MNFTIRYLIQQNLFLHLSLFNNKNNYKFQKISIFKSFNQFGNFKGNFLVFNQCKFKNFLNNILKFSNELKVFSEKFNTNNFTFVIKRSLFITSQCTTNGGAIETNFICNLKIEECIFENNCASSKGGSIYHTGGFFILNKCCFKYCRCYSGDINDGGNIFRSSGDINSSFISANICWNTTLTNADSIFHTFYGIFQLIEYNLTNNDVGGKGACGGALHNTNSNSFCKYFNVLKSRDATQFEVWSSHTPIVSYSNFINNTLFSYIFYLSSGSIHFLYVNFFGNSKLSPIGGTVTYINCYGDYSATGIQITSLITHFLTGFNNECIFPLNNQITNIYGFHFLNIFNTIQIIILSF